MLLSFTFERPTHAQCRAKLEMLFGIEFSVCVSRGRNASEIISGINTDLICMCFHPLARIMACNAACMNINFQPFERRTLTERFSQLFSFFFLQKL